MKKKLFILLTSLLSTIANAQNWCPPGATWYYSVWSGMLGFDAVVEYKYTGDTSLAGTNCKIVKGTFQGVDFYAFGTFSPTTIVNYRTYYTYENNDVVYLYNGTSFDTIVNYNANVGDKWLSPNSCGMRFPYKVIKTGTISVNNTNLRTISASYVYTYIDSGITITDSIWVEHFEKIQGQYAGSWRSLFFYSCPLTQAPIPYETPFRYYCGYSDQSTPLQLPETGVCRRITDINEAMEDDKLPKLFPNPNSGIFNLQIQKPSFVKIYSISGELITKIAFEEGGNYMINKSELSTGIYFVKIENKSSSSFVKLIKE